MTVACVRRSDSVSRVRLAFGREGRRSARPAQHLEDGNFRLLGEGEKFLLKNDYWIRPATGQAGNAIDFFVKLRGMRFDCVMLLHYGTSGLLDNGVDGEGAEREVLGN